MNYVLELLEEQLSAQQALIADEQVTTLPIMEEKCKQLTRAIALLTELREPAKYTIAISLVPHGYEINMLNHREVLRGRFVPEHTECRSYGTDIDVADSTCRILNYVRKLERS